MIYRARIRVRGRSGSIAMVDWTMAWGFIDDLSFYFDGVTADWIWE